ncbi:sensor histidine kinase [Jeongeupia chitinilytica]|uniref:histidine kinase n=1 Tax=Jeongeupia chitinilytica TaxID=1041641 RepID=A0ABQ3H218_9NEIS|nr:sensor histidine kinase [Jeongeupia chitinilytica]GHD60948.1 hybrid sensor histidine kinase/response regulator [Jeongeupia chitinilytica]
MAFRITVVSLAISAVSYYYSYTRLQEEALGNLEKYIKARSQLESEPFLQAETNTTLLRNEFIRRYAQMQGVDVSADFHALMKQDKDGMWRVRVERDDFEYRATVALLPRVELTPEFMRQVMLGYELLGQYGPAFRNRYYDTFIDLNVSDGSLMFLPDLNYARNGSVADFEFDLETEVGATPARNPERKTFWTGIYFDKQAMQWMVSVVTPIDYLGRYIGSAGQDVLLDQLIARTNSVGIPGTTNFIVTRQGELIAHPDRMSQIEAMRGHYNLRDADDPALRDMYAAVTSATPKQLFVESPDGKSWLGMAQIRGADWLFVTVYPKRLLQEKAALAASMVLLLGLIALLIELGLMAWVLKVDVARPLGRLKAAIQSLAQGRHTHPLDTDRTDELGELARNFDTMAMTIAHHRQHLEDQVATRTEELALRNAQLESANAELSRLNEEKNELLTIAAHDLKNPVASIGGMASLIGSKFDVWPKERVRDRLAGISQLAHRIQRILGNLLDINTLESGQYRLTLEPISLDELLAELLASWEGRLEEKQQHCQWQPHGLIVQADRQALWQVLDNLISNASKYAPHRSRIEIAAALSLGMVEIGVHDRGPGIAPHEMDKLFRKFGRLSAVPTGGEHTTGLGLSIVKRLAEEMGGGVRCDSLLGHGTTFTVSLPQPDTDGLHHRGGKSTETLLDPDGKIGI